MKRIILLLTITISHACCVLAQSITHEVKRGETFESISEKYGISPEELKTNNPRHSVCYVGLKLNIPQKGQAPTNNSKHTIYDDFIENIKAAQDGDIKAFVKVGECYEKGHGTDIDTKQAVAWYKYGTIQKSDDCKFALGRCYEKGIGMEADIRQALRIYGELALNEYTASQKHLKELNYEQRSWQYLAAYGQVPESVKQKWEEEKRQKEQEREQEQKRKQEEQKRQEEQRRQQEAVRQASARQEQSVQTQSRATRSATKNLLFKGGQILQELVNSMSNQPNWSSNVIDQHIIDDTDGVQTMMTKMPCVSCNSTGICNACQIAVVAGQQICPMCNGTRRCQLCKGRGYSISYSKFYPTGDIAVFDENGKFLDARVRSSGSNYSDNASQSSSSSTRNYSSRSTCPKCGGKKFGRECYEFAAGSSAGWAQPHHNYAGSSCSICGRTSDHYHYPCTECQGHGTIKN